ncbi:MAG: MBL fold metallo-hydrolase [Cellulomonadaceae bacterium]|nr:MBL fold metallo-hydrolase [Cellulomonadaceae bacterium]
MTYTGSVRTGQPAAVRELDALTLRKISVGEMDNNAYLLTCRHTGAQLLVDAAADAETLLDLVHQGSPTGRLDAVVTTHRHPDHHGALAEVLAATGADHLCGAQDAAAIGLPVARGLDDADVVEIGELRLEVIGLRGHTPGSIALAFREPDLVTADGALPGRAHLMTGDSLFPGGPGRTVTRTDFTQLMTDLEERVFARFDDATHIYPGHGDDTTLGVERAALPAWWARGW